MLNISQHNPLHYSELTDIVFSEAYSQESIKDLNLTC